MAKSSRASNPQYHVQSLHEYALTPLSAAASRLEREQTEIAAERDAFRTFRERVADIRAGSTPTPRTIPERTGHSPQSSGLDDVRSAYRETVMDVPHYERMYGESLTEHAAAELGPELARQLDETTAVGFTAPLREAMTAAAQRAVDDRCALLERLDEEQSSIETAREAIAELLRPLASTVIPEWHRETFLRRLDSIADRRQKTLHTADSLPDGSDYSLCAHLYGSTEWNHPVLASVARVRETVTVDDSGERTQTPRRRESS